jgi:hypothetical protein
MPRGGRTIPRGDDPPSTPRRSCPGGTTPLRPPAGTGEDRSRAWPEVWTLVVARLPRSDGEPSTVNSERPPPSSAFLRLPPPSSAFLRLPPPSSAFLRLPPPSSAFVCTFRRYLGAVIPERFPEPILHVDMDAFFVEVERLRRPELQGVPVVVGGDGPRSVVAAASYEARRFGVGSAMPMVEARRRCRDLTIVPVDHDEYGRVSTRVFEILRSFTPWWRVCRSTRPFSTWPGCDSITARRRRWAVSSAARSAQSSDLPASVGVATCKFVAKLASQDAKPDGLLVIPAGDQQAYLDALPVAACGGWGRPRRPRSPASGW